MRVAGSILRLPEQVANQIAAGEVVERPASVVKELVENALDAGAHAVEVEIREGGREYIRVRDDGRGIPADQVLLAFERHATSKIRAAADLFAVTSLGFRGEALPSIASVSELEMRTRTPSEDAGTLVHLEGGRIVDHRPDGCPAGTTVIVRRLFYNTPARYKFLRTPAAEARHVLDTVGRLALARPDCAFTLVTDGRRALRTEGDGDLRAAAGCVLGRKVEQALLPCQGEWPGGGISGWIAHPDVHRGNRDFLVLSLNGRPIHSPALVRAVEKGYETLLPSRRFPAAVLHLRLDPGLVDVNVHPTKREVRFSGEQDLFRRVLRAVRECLVGHNLTIPLGGSASAEPPVAGRAEPGAAAALWARETPAQAPPFPEPVPLWRPAAEDAPSAPPPPRPGGEAPFRTPLPRPEPGPFPPGRRGACAVDLRRAREGAAPGGPLAGSAPAGGDATAVRRQLRDLTLAGSLDYTFWIGIARGELWIIDQHIAHERVLYEHFLRRPEALEPAAGRQHLLHPLLIDVSAAEAAAWHEHREWLADAGFIVEPFGARTFRLRAVPTALSAMPPRAVEEALREALQHDEGPEGAREARMKNLAARLACRMSVKAGDPLPLETGRVLLRRLAETENPFTCPHGRPIIAIITRGELERRFLRL